MTWPLGSHPTDRLPEIQRPQVHHLAAIRRSAAQRSDDHHFPTWHPSNGQATRDPTPSTLPLGRHPTIRLIEIRRPELDHLAAIPRSGCQRSDAHDVATWHPSYSQATRDLTPTRLPLGSRQTVSFAHVVATWRPSQSICQRSDPTRLPLRGHRTVQRPEIDLSPPVCHLGRHVRLLALLLAACFFISSMGYKIKNTISMNSPSRNV